jgi:flagellar basal-body rod protein FlgB
MFIDGLTNSGALPSLERTMQFAARRQELIAHNIANLSTPNFQPLDVSVSSFQTTLADAVDRRRERFGSSRGELELESTREVHITGQGLQLTPQTPSGNILFHDRNNRDLERQMQSMVENLTVFRTAADLFKSRMDLLNTAIRERL